VTALLAHRRYLRVSEFVDSLELRGRYVSQSTIRRRLATGELRGRRVGGRWRVLASELNRYPVKGHAA
jgi:excisionase family DNA binding protein